MEGQDGSQIHQKSIKIEFPRPSASASFFTSIFDRFLLSTSTPWISKKCIFPKEKQGFFKKPPFEDNIDFGFDFGANLPPCCPPKSKIFRFLEVPRGLQNFIVFRIDFLLLLAPSWLPTWSHLGSQDAPNGLQKLRWCAPKTLVVRPKSGYGYEPAFEDRSRASWLRFLEGQGSIFCDFWMMFEGSWPT